MTKLIFDKNNPNWTDNNIEYNTKFIAMIKQYFSELIHIRGYIYLNQIYEKLGFKWDIANENTCYTNYKEFQTTQFTAHLLTNEQILIIIKD